MGRGGRKPFLALGALSWLFARLLSHGGTLPMHRAHPSEGKNGFFADALDDVRWRAGKLRFGLRCHKPGRLGVQPPECRLRK